MENLVLGMVFCTHSKETDKKVRYQCFYNFVLLTRLEIYGNHHFKKNHVYVREHLGGNTWKMDHTFFFVFGEWELQNDMCRKAQILYEQKKCANPQNVFAQKGGGHNEWGSMTPDTMKCVREVKGAKNPESQSLLRDGGGFDGIQNRRCEKKYVIF